MSAFDRFYNKAALYGLHKSVSPVNKLCFEDVSLDICGSTKDELLNILDKQLDSLLELLTTDVSGYDCIKFSSCSQSRCHIHSNAKSEAYKMTIHYTVWRRSSNDNNNDNNKTNECADDNNHKTSSSSSIAFVVQSI